MSRSAGIRRLATGLLAAAITAAGAGTAGAQLTINEVDYEQGGPDEADFIELYNAGAEPFDASGYVLELVDDAGTTLEIYRTIELPAGTTIAAGGFYVVCIQQEVTPGCDLAVQQGVDLIRDGPFNAIGLRPDLGSAVIDALSYEGDVRAPYIEGKSVTAGDRTLVFASIGRFPDGKDTQDNSADFIGACATPGNSNGDLIGECCGDGVVNGEEECDEGRMNGRVPCGCRSDCTVSPEASECAASECEIGVCDASGACIEPKLVPAGTPCGDRTDSDCTDVDTCDGAGVCQPNDVPDNTACDDAPDLMDCPGLCSAGTCVAEDDNGECVPVMCGDGIVAGLEECDDGNQVDGDGCEDCIGDGGNGGCGCQTDSAGGLALALIALMFLLAQRFRRRSWLYDRRDSR